MLSQKYSSKAIQLISINSFGKIVLHAEAAAFLRTLAPPISLVTLAGPVRTGKTFLMQQIVSQGGLFAEGRTAGLWIWSKPMLAYNQEGRIASVLLLDSQGFQPEGSKNDQTLIALLLLLANCLLYNSAGPIDSLSFRELEAVMAIARQLKDKNCDFHWLLRDFDPTLVDPLGADITGHQYMENQLMAADSFAEKTVGSLREIFPNRRCHCFVKPVPEAIEQPPQFLKQVIELRKCLNGVPSLNLEGGAIVAVVQAYIDSLNAGDSLAKAEMEGRDCRMRLECLARLGEELRGLEQRQSCNQIEDLQEQLGDIRTQLKEYYKQRMCSHRQIQDLDEELNQIIQDFQELNDRPRTPVISRQIIRLNVPKQEKMVRLSLNISESDKDRMDFDSRARLDSRPNLPLTSIGRINTDKNLHSKMEEYQAKIYRYQLEANCSRRELEGLKDEYDESRRELDSKTDQIEDLIERNAQLQRQYEAKFQQQDEQLEELRKAKIMVESQLAKVQVLHEEKVTYLEEQLMELGEQREEELRLKEDKYRVKIGECLKEIQDLKKSHEEELAHLKKLYQQSHEQLTDSKHQQSTDTFYKEMREQMQQLQSLKELLDRERFGSAQKDETITSLNKQLAAREEFSKDALEQAGKRAKDAERHLEDMFDSKMKAKAILIEELQQRINQISNSNQDSLNRIISQNNRLLAELEQKERKLTTFSTASEQTSREMGKLKDDLQEFEQSIQTLTDILKKKEQQSALQSQKQEQLSCEQQELKEALQKKEQELEEVQGEVSELKGQVSILQETHQFEVTRLKETYESQMAEYRSLFETDKQRLQVKLKELQNVAQIGRRVREDYEELQHESAVTEFQLREALDERDRQLDSTKACLKELTHEYEGLASKNSELLAGLVKAREESILSCEEAAESQRRVKEDLEDMLEKSIEASREKEKVIATLRQQLEKEIKSNTLKTQNHNRQMEQVQTKQRNWQIQYTKQNAKMREQLEESKKAVNQLSQQVALLNHKISLQEQSLSFKSESKNLEIGKLTEKLKALQSKSAQSNTLAIIYQEQLKQEQQEGARLQRLLAAFFKEKEIALSNLQDLDNRARMSERKYEAHLNLFQEKLKEKKQECIELRERLEQYREDYQNLQQIKTTLERSLQKESLLMQYRQQIAAHRAQ